MSKTSNPQKRRRSSQNRPIFVPNLAAGGTGIDLISGVAPFTSISGTRYGIVNNIVTQFEVNQPPIEDDGLRGCPAFTQYFLNNEVPVTQSITLAAGSYCLWIEGTGSATFNGLIATAGVPKLFTLASSFTGNCVITGSVTKAMLNSGLFPTPFSPTEGIIKSFVSEAATATTGTSFDLDDVKLARFKTALRGPNAQGHIELTFKSNVNSGWLDAGVRLTLFSCANDNNIGLRIVHVAANNNAIGVYDGSVADVWIQYDREIVVGEIFKISIDWGTHSTGKKMRLTVNGVKSSLVDFSGSFGSQDLRFFFGNTVHAGWIKKDSLKIYDRPRW